MTPLEINRHICAAAQPSSVNGTPDTLIRRGVEATLEVTGAFAAALVRAVSGKTSAKAIETAINATARGFSRTAIERPVRRELLHGAMLGALDSRYEGESGKAIKPESFAQLHAVHVLAGPFHDTRFADRPMKEAIEQFLKKKTVTRDVFDAMEKDAQRRAFTVARAATEEMVKTIKRELLRQLAVGADFAEFGKHAAERFESAGWVPSSGSHVETIFRTNTMSSYSAGRLRQMTQPAVLAVRPWFESIPVGDGPPRQRPTHIKFVLRASDPFWQTACPPYGYNCRCRLRSLSVRQGAGRVQEGTSILGLPDPGFASGMGTLLTTDLPSMTPANDPPPEREPAND